MNVLHNTFVTFLLFKLEFEIQYRDCIYLTYVLNMRTYGRKKGSWRHIGSIWVVHVGSIGEKRDTADVGPMLLTHIGPMCHFQWVFAHSDSIRFCLLSWFILTICYFFLLFKCIKSHSMLTLFKPFFLNIKNPVWHESDMDVQELTLLVFWLGKCEPLKEA